MSIEQERALSRLGRCVRWVETGRSNGLVFLQGMRRGRLILETFNETTLKELLIEGVVRCDVSERIALNTNFNQPRPVEVTQKYWSVV